MARRARRNHKPQFKAKVALEALKGEQTIVHELLHFSVPNHGKLWKSLMRTHLGEYELQEARLKQY